MIALASADASQKYACDVCKLVWWWTFNEYYEVARRGTGNIPLRLFGRLVLKDNRFEIAQLSTEEKLKLSIGEELPPKKSGKWKVYT